MARSPVLLLTLLLTVGAVPAHAAELVSVKKIWGAADSGMPHQAFTDLIRFKGRLYLGLREALKHHGGLAGKGRLRVLRSADGEVWQSAGVFKLAEGDLRDAKLSITDRGELMLNSAIQVYHPDPVKHKNFAWFSRDGETWSEPVQFGEADYWIWSVTWHDGVAYGVGYPTTGKATKTRLYSSEDGRNWQILVPEFYAGNESALAFKPDGTAVCLMRSGNAIGQANAPYTEWTWKKTVNLGGPDLLQLPDGRFVTGGRHGGWGTMKLFEIDPDTGRTALLLSLPARGDSGYPGLVYHDNLLWVSYYSSADDATDGGLYLVPSEIRLAKVKLDKTSALLPLAKPVNIRLSAEDDAGTTAVDQAAADGRQDATLLNGTQITTQHAAVGSRSYAFGTSAPSPDLIDLPGTSNLGSTFTLAAFVKTRSTAHQRLFSTFHGTATAGEVILDLDTDNNTRGLEGLRFYVGGVGAVVRGLPAADGQYHHYAVTYDDGRVQLYFDGRPLGDPATLGSGPLQLASDLRVGEDRAAKMTNEAFVGYLDEILIADHAMSQEALAAMAATTAMRVRSKNSAEP